MSDTPQPTEKSSDDTKPAASAKESPKEKPSEDTKPAPAAKESLEEKPSEDTKPVPAAKESPKEKPSEDTKPAPAAKESPKEKPSEDTKPAPAAKESPKEKPAAKPAAKAKPPKPEDKPFPEFIDTLFIPAVEKQLGENSIKPERLERVTESRPVVGGDCSMVVGVLPGGRRFWVCFAKENINSPKHIALAEPGSEPTLLESFLIDEKRMTLPLLVSRLLQRLNGQKWLGRN